MAAAWQGGERPGVEEILASHPALASQPRAVLRLISEELFLRQESGEPAELEQILSRFPQWRAELELLLACHNLFEAERSPPDFPVAGEPCGDFELLREIGRGSQGRVFLATQPSLSDRPVVIKLTALNVAEHLSLARLQHTGIVPLYLAQDLPERRLRLMCMPFMDGASVAAILAAMKPIPIAERSGRTVAEALACCHIEAPGAAPLGGPALDFLSQATYAQAVCWIGACLAEALHYAHQRGLVHFDIKPSNLLLAGDGQPMLLDFHLARGPLIPGESKTTEWVGGTRQYMPPEQAVALEAVRESRPVEAVVDARADIYALAMVLDELLGGEGPLARPIDSSYGLRRLNPNVSAGLADILSKCLSPDAAARYGDAQILADDLRRHLADLPLRGVANRSPLELWNKWRRRRPHAAVRLISSTVACLALAVAAWIWGSQRIDEAQRGLIDAQQLLDRHAYSEAIDRLREALDAVRPIPAESALMRTLQDRLELARRAKLAAELHRFVEKLRFLDGAPPKDAAGVHSAEQTCQVFWDIRQKLLDAYDPSSAEDTQVRADYLDLVVCWLEMQSRLTGKDRGRSAEAAALVDEAEAALGASPVLDAERRFLRGDDSSLTTSDNGAPVTTRQRYALGRLRIRTGDDKRALDEFRAAVRAEPQDFWANYYHGRCAYRLASYAEALNAFCVCVALAPNQAECFYNRALVYTALGQQDEAQLDYNQALKLDPTLAAAAANDDALGSSTH